MRRSAMLPHPPEAGAPSRGSLRLVAVSLMSTSKNLASHKIFRRKPASIKARSFQKIAQHGFLYEMCIENPLAPS